MEAPIVLKLGGSLLGGSYLGAWLAALPALAGRAVLVPGGGPFADAVRAAQARHDFDDRTAHRMALLAMEQTGWIFCALAPCCAPAGEPETMRFVLASRRVPVWLPAAMAPGEPEVPEGWETTSDSLAAWLAGRLGTPTVILVKSAPLSDPAAPLAELAKAGIVDPVLPGLVSRLKLTCRVFGPERAAAFAADCGVWGR